MSALLTAPRPAWRRFLRLINPWRVIRLVNARVWLKWTEEDIDHFSVMPGVDTGWLIRALQQAAALRAEIRELERI